VQEGFHFGIEIRDRDALLRTIVGEETPIVEMWKVVVLEFEANLLASLRREYRIGRRFPATKHVGEFLDGAAPAVEQVGKYISTRLFGESPVESVVSESWRDVRSTVLVERILSVHAGYAYSLANK
jgi:hypothetical protein